MSQITTKEYSDDFLKDALTKIVAEIQLQHNLSRDEAISKVKQCAYKVLFMYRKKTVDAAIDALARIE